MHIVWWCIALYIGIVTTDRNVSDKPVQTHGEILQSLVQMLSCVCTIGELLWSCRYFALLNVDYDILQESTTVQVPMCVWWMAEQSSTDDWKCFMLVNGGRFVMTTLITGRVLSSADNLANSGFSSCCAAMLLVTTVSLYWSCYTDIKNDY